MENNLGQDRALELDAVLHTSNTEGARSTVRYRLLRAATATLVGLCLAGAGFGYGLLAAPAMPPTTPDRATPACAAAIAAARDAFKFDDAASRARASAIAVTGDVLPAEQEGRAADLLDAVEQAAQHRGTEAEQLAKRDTARADFADAAAQCSPEQDAPQTQETDH